MNNTERNITWGVETATCIDPSVIMTISDEHRGLYVFIAVLNGILAVVAVLGNALILVALPKASSLHAPARALYFNLALSDISVGFVLQPSYVAYVVGGISSKPALRCYARIIFGFASDYVIALSYLTMTAISMDRFLALHLLMSYRRIVTLKRTAIAIVTSWIFCTIFPIVRIYNIWLSHLASLIGFIVCLFISSATNAILYRKLQKHEIEVQRVQSIKNPLSLAHYKRSVNLVWVVYCAHLVCYLPSMGVTIAFVVSPSREWLIVFANFVGTLLLGNSALNPFLYCWRARAVRKPALETLDRVMHFFRKY